MRLCGKTCTLEACGPFVCSVIFLHFTTTKISNHHFLAFAQAIENLDELLIFSSYANLPFFLASILAGNFDHDLTVFFAHRFDRGKEHVRNSFDFDLPGRRHSRAEPSNLLPKFDDCVDNFYRVVPATHAQDGTGGDYLACELLIG